MTVGDLVKNKTAVPIFGLGIVMRPEMGGWWIHWHCGTWGFHIRTDLEVVSESR